MCLPLPTICVNVWTVRLPSLQVTLDNQHLPEFQRELARFNFNDDCPVFDGMFDYCRWGFVAAGIRNSA
jgi:hypothetical protein